MLLFDYIISFRRICVIIFLGVSSRAHCRNFNDNSIRPSDAYIMQE